MSSMVRLYDIGYICSLISVNPYALLVRSMLYSMNGSSKTISFGETLNSCTNHAAPPPTKEIAMINTTAVIGTFVDSPLLDIRGSTAIVIPAARNIRLIINGIYWLIFTSTYPAPYTTPVVL